MGELKAIETNYDGYRFRSRLEARWAVFFDTLGIKYEYEPEGFEMSNGERYLPDFYFPEFGMYAEVKGESGHVLEDMKRVERFVLENKSEVVILSNIPHDDLTDGLYLFPFMYFESRQQGMTSMRYLLFLYDDDDGARIEDDFSIGHNRRWNYDSYYYKGDKNKYAFEMIQAISASELYKDYKEREECDALLSVFSFSAIQEAILRARQARFEHGETPEII